MTAGAARTFHVVTQRRWMVQELTAGLTPAGWTVQSHHGLSALPPQVGLDPDHVLWAPQAFAARALFSGSPLRLSSPGPRWLPGLWLNDLAREVVLLTVEVAAASPSEGFWKLAEAKWDRFPARWRTAPQLTADLAGSALPGGSQLHYCPTRLRCIREYRAIVDLVSATTISCYLDNHDRSRDHPDFVEANRVCQATAVSQATRLAAWLEQDAPAGPAYALDLSGSGAIIEANPVWCSSWYGCDLPAFAAAVAAAQGSDVPGDHLWAPDPALVLRARRLGLLPVDRTDAASSL